MEAITGTCSLPIPPLDTIDLTLDRLDTECFVSCTDAPSRPPESGNPYWAWPSRIFEAGDDPVDVVLDNFNCHRQWEKQFMGRRKMCVETNGHGRKYVHYPCTKCDHLVGVH